MIDNRHRSDYQSDERDQDDKKRLADFQESQKVVKKRKVVDVKGRPVELKRTSYGSRMLNPVRLLLSLPQTRPLSPITQEPLRRRTWPVALQSGGTNSYVISGKSFQKSNGSHSLWTDKKTPGTLVLTDIYQQLLEGRMSPTNRKIKYTGTATKW
jgi:hypothetical protein